MEVNKKSWMIGASTAVAVGLTGGVFGAFLSVAHPALSSSTTTVASAPVTIEPGTPILLFNNGEAHASVKVDRNGLILLNLTTKTGQNQIALGVLGDSKLEVGVFDSAGKARAGMEVPMKDSGQRPHASARQARSAAECRHSRAKLNKLLNPPVTGLFHTPPLLQKGPGDTSSSLFFRFRRGRHSVRDAMAPTAESHSCCV